MIIDLDLNLEKIQFNESAIDNKILAKKISKKFDLSKYQPVDITQTSNLTTPGLFGLLSKCYSNHLPVKINPHDIWILLSGQMSSIISSDVEYYRELFTDSKDKENISVAAGDPVNLPFDSVIALLKDKVNFDISIVTPDFSTDDDSVRLMKSAIFLEMSSNYYTYSMFCCGIPKINLGGTKEDWEKLLSSFNILYKTFYNYNTPEKYGAWIKSVKSILTKLVEEFDSETPDVEFFKNIFTQNNVGSGRQLEINGWVTELFFDPPKILLLHNFLSSVAKVEYKNESTNKEYVALLGGCSYKVNEDFYELIYTKHVYEKV